MFQTFLEWYDASFIGDYSFLWWFNRLLCRIDGHWTSYNLHAGVQKDSIIIFCLRSGCNYEHWDILGGEKK